MSDFSAAFDIIDHILLLEKRMCYVFTPPAIMWIKIYLSNRTHRVFFNGSLSNIIVWWSAATKKDLGKLQLAQNRAARLALGCTQRANITNMHVNLSWLKVEERLTSSLLLFMRGIDMNAQSYLSKLLAHSSDPHAYPTIGFSLI